LAKGDIALQSHLPTRRVVCPWWVHLDPILGRVGRSLVRVSASKERWWFRLSIGTIAQRYYLLFGRNSRSNVSDAQINRRRVTLGRNLEREGLTDKAKF